MPTILQAGARFDVYDEETAITDVMLDQIEKSASGEKLCLLSPVAHQVVADIILFATTFCLLLIHSVAPLFQIITASLGCDLTLSARKKAMVSILRNYRNSFQLYV